MNYNRSAIDIAMELGSDIETGLTIEKAHERIHSRGRNTIRAPKARRTFGFFRGLFSPVNIILLLMAIMHLAATDARGFGLSLCLALCACVNAAVGCIGFRGDETLLSAAKTVSNENVRVIRSGIEKTINAALLAQGDVIALEKGQIVPADAKIIECTSLVVDESILNGDGSFVVKDLSVEDSDESSAIYMGTKILDGSVKAIVTAVGDKTQLGSSVDMLARGGQKSSALARKNQALGNVFGAAAALIWISAFVIRFVGGYGIVSAFDNSISAALSVVPVVLPTLVLAMTAADVFRLKRKGIGFRSLLSMEALGAASVLCVGKRGTLTKSGFKTESIKAGKGFDENTLSLLAAMCTTVEIDGKRVLGDPMQLALVENAGSRGFSASDIRLKMPLERVLDNRSDKRVMTTVHKTENGYTVICKGAPDAVASRCSCVYDNGIRAFDAKKDIAEIMEESAAMSAEALSVIGVAYKDVSGLDGPLEDGLIFVGLIGLSSEVRKDTPSSVKSLKSMGVRTCLLTNENLTTASAVAEKCKISVKKVVQGAELDELDDRRIGKTSVFADLNPKQKSDVVAALGANGENVAVVGRGARDIGAMNSAAVSVATASSARICRAAAEVTVDESGLGSIARAIGECRRSRNNIGKIMGFFLSCSVAQALCALTALVMGYSTPFTPQALLWLNVCVCAVGAIAIWKEPYRRGENAPKPVAVVARGLLVGAAAMLAYGLGIGSIDVAARRAMVVMILAFGFAFMAQSCRRGSKSKTKRKNSIAPLCFALNIAVIFLTLGFNAPKGFGIDTPSLGMLGGCAAIGLVPTLVCEAFKYIRSGKNKKTKRRKTDGR